MSMMPISSPNPIFDHLLHLSHLDDSNKWSRIEFGLEIAHSDTIKVNPYSAGTAFMHMQTG